ncbi:MAG: hypothetical protein WB992_14450 [Bryobacteraceae bacterium]
MHEMLPALLRMALVEDAATAGSIRAQAQCEVAAGRVSLGTANLSVKAQDRYDVELSGVGVMIAQKSD